MRHIHISIFAVILMIVLLLFTPLFISERSFLLHFAVITLLAICLMWTWNLQLKKELSLRTRASEQTTLMLRDIIDEVPHQIFVKDYSGRFVLANKATALYYKVDVTELIGKKNSDFISDKQTGQELTSFYLERDRRIIEQKISLFIPEELSTDLEGNEHYFSVFKKPLRVAENQEFAALTVAVDITTNVQNRKTLQEQADALLEAELRMADLDKKAVLGSMVAGITHEINNPIGVSVTALSHLKSEYNDCKLKIVKEGLTINDMNEFIDTFGEAIDILEKNLDRSVNMISSFKKMSVDQLSGQKEYFNLCEVIEHVLISLKHEIKKGSHTILFKCKTPLLLYSYPGSFSQIMTNLIMNSLVHGFEHKEKGTIKINASLEDNLLSIHYEDDGIGMDEATLSKAWQPYFTTKRSAGGTGLGMQIIYNIVVRTLDGTIHFTSELNHGVTCEIVIPLTQKPGVDD